MFSSTFNEEERLWNGPNISPVNPDLSLSQALLHSMVKFGPKIAQISDDSGIKVTFDEMRTRTIRAAQNLQSLGFKRNQVFVIVANNSHNVAPILCATIAMGCTVSCLNPKNTDKEHSNLLRILDPALVLCDTDCYESVSKCLSRLGNTAKEKKHKKKNFLSYALERKVRPLTHDHIERHIEQNKMREK